MPTSADRKLLMYAEAGDSAGVVTAPAASANPDASDYIAGDIALILAASAGSSKSVAALLDAGAEVACGDEDGTAPLMHAAIADDIESVRLLITAKAKADAKAKDREGNTAIWHAADRGHGAVVETLAPHSTPKERRRAEARLRLLRQGPPPAEWQVVLDLIPVRPRNEAQAAQERFLQNLKEAVEAGTSVDWADGVRHTNVFYHRLRQDFARGRSGSRRRRKSRETGSTRAPTSQPTSPHKAVEPQRRDVCSMLQIRAASKR